MRPAIYTRDAILTSALHLAAEMGYTHVTRPALCLRVGCHAGTVTHYWPTMKQFKRSLMRFAVAHGDLVVIAQGLALRDPHAQHVGREMRLEALARLAE